LILTITEHASATGPFLNLPVYYGRIDTSRAVLDIGQSFVEGEFENSAALSVEAGFRSGERTRVRLQALYSALRKEGSYNHGFGDLLINGEMRIVGDSLRISGLFLRGDMRIPTGSASMWPYAGESLNGGAGLELRKLSETLNLRCSATYTLVEKKVEEESYRSDNYFLAGALLGFKPMNALMLEFSVFGQFFRNGDYREVYLLSAVTAFRSDLELRIGGGVDSGKSHERVWNSMIHIGINWKFPGVWKRDPGSDDKPPEHPANKKTTP
jgi:hypothetical protein